MDNLIHLCFLSDSADGENVEPKRKRMRVIGGLALLLFSKTHCFPNNARLFKATSKHYKKIYSFV